MVALLGAMAELADATDLKSVGRDTLWVRPPLALPKSRFFTKRDFWFLSRVSSTEISFYEGEEMPN